MIAYAACEAASDFRLVPEIMLLIFVPIFCWGAWPSASDECYRSCMYYVLRFPCLDPKDMP